MLRFLEEKSRTLQTPTGSTPTGTGTGTGAAAAPAVFIYNIYPIQDSVSSTDTLAAAKPYAQIVNDFVAALDTPEKFKALVSAVPVVFASPPGAVKDTETPVLSFSSTPANFTYDKTGMKNFTLTIYNPTQVLCWWLLQSGTDQPAASVIQGCNSTTNNCGVSPVTPAGNNITSNGLVSLNLNTDYSFWSYCSNNVPQSTKFANVTKMYSFTTTSSGGSTTQPNTTQPNTTNPNTTTPNNTLPNTTTPVTNKTAGSFIAYGIAFLALLFIL
jgi:hypothetical protein